MLLFDFHGQRRCFADPVGVITAERLEDVRPALLAVQRAADTGLYAAGYVAYEAAPAFDPAMAVRSSSPLPLLWFGLFTGLQPAPPHAPGPFHTSPWVPSVARDRYDADIACIHGAIGRGDTYQVNHTLRLRAHFSGDDLAFYERLRAAQQANYCAYLQVGRHRILSASPELFFQWQDGSITTRPMKGTAARGRWGEEDAQRAAALAGSVKERAENLMIVDLLRNDLGRIAVTGSVRVPHLFAVEAYPTVLQMTSTVEARTRPGLTLEDVFAALFPCGSVTGAPKISTMGLIAELEEAPRGVYCGAIGLVLPGGAATFNVAIRTVVLDTADGSAEYGVGGGITWDSTAEGEYAEVGAKAALLSAEWPSFELLETLLLRQGDYVLLDGHLARLAESAHYFGIPLALDGAQAVLETHAREHGCGEHRVRLLVSQAGAIRVESEPLRPLPPAPLPVALALAPVSQYNRFLFHKTTRRDLYEQHRAAAPHAFDVLLWNEQGELTELTIGNLVLELDGCRWTPPRQCGLLAGVLRAELLAQGLIRERVLRPEDLARATGLWLINSVRGWVELQIVP